MGNKGVEKRDGGGRKEEREGKIVGGEIEVVGRQSSQNLGG